MNESIPNRVDVYVRSPRELFQGEIRYQIPSFQRRYVWNKEKHWRPLWEDVQGVATRLIDGGTTGGHFLGAVVLQDRSTPIGEPKTKLVVDGQQRLTTIQLLLDAVGKSSANDDSQPDNDSLAKLVWNDGRPIDGTDEFAFKVWPTVLDQDPYKHSIAATSTALPPGGTLPISEAHKYFVRKATEWIAADKDRRETRIAALRKVLTDFVHLVVIDLTASDDPHVIFESLNARGEQLVQSDLVKNMMMYEADRQGETTGTQDGSWLWPFNDGWWVREVGRGRLKQMRVDIYLHHWLTVRTGKRVVSDEVFLGFRRHYNESGALILSTSTDLDETGRIYRQIENQTLPERWPGVKDLDLFLYRRKVMNNTVVVPVLLWLFDNNVPNHQISKALRALESHMVRRMVKQVYVSNNDAFLAMLNRLKDSDPVFAGDVIVEFLRRQDAPSSSWPTDDEMKQAMVIENSYGLTRGRLRLVLEGIEQGMRTEKTEDARSPKDLTIERIMPEKWRENYPLRAGIDGGTRDFIINTMGNLTLVNGKLNSSMSNAPWRRKRLELNRHSTLFLNKDLTSGYPADKWSEEEIVKRGAMMWDAAKKVWPSADDL